MTTVSDHPQALFCPGFQERLGAPYSTSLPFDLGLQPLAVSAHPACRAPIGIRELHAALGLVMTAHCPPPHKISGTAADLLDYYKEIGLELSFDRTVGYYGIGTDEVVFDVIGGNAAQHLPGLDMTRGITRTQFEDIMFKGQWNGTQLVTGGHRPVCKRDHQGNEIKALNPETGKYEPIYEYETTVDPAGNQGLRKKMEPVFVAGYDCPISMDKSHPELLVDLPWYAQRYRQHVIESVNVSMRQSAELHNRVYKKTVAAPSVVGDRGTKTQGSASELAPVEGLLWFPVFGMAARPTPQSTERGYGADPHIATHIIVSSVAYVGNGKFQKIDGDFLFKTAEFRAQVFSTTLNRLLEDDGVLIRYADPDHKGRTYSEIEGSNPEFRSYFSTASAEVEQLKLDYELEHGHGFIDRGEFEQRWSRVKGHKTRQAKRADVFGSVEQLAMWRQARKEAGIEQTIKPITDPVARAPVDERLELLFDRLESKVGVILGAGGEAPIFGPEVIRPAAWRLAEGLGLTPEQIEEAASTYREGRLILVRDAVKPSARLYTTQSVVTAEIKIGSQLDRLGAGTSPSVPREAVDAVIARQTHAPDPGQRELIRAICSESKLVHGVGHAGAGKEIYAKLSLKK